MGMGFPGFTKVGIILSINNIMITICMGVMGFLSLIVGIPVWVKEKRASVPKILSLSAKEGKTSVTSINI